MDLTTYDLFDALKIFTLLLGERPSLQATGRAICRLPIWSMDTKPPITQPVGELHITPLL